jgi:Protein of unknown function (DUF3800)
LIYSIIEEVPNYFCQRRPKELASFEWFIDAKDKNITSQERWWRDSLGPMLQSRSRRKAVARVDAPGFNYKHFDRSFQTKFLDPAADGTMQRSFVTDIRKLVIERLSFVDSKSDILVQATDVLVRTIRRVLTNAIDEMLVEALGRLQILRNRSGTLQSLQFIWLTDDD